MLYYKKKIQLNTKEDRSVGSEGQKSIRHIENKQQNKISSYYFECN